MVMLAMHLWQVLPFMRDETSKLLHTKRPVKTTLSARMKKTLLVENSLLSPQWQPTKLINKMVKKQLIAIRELHLQPTPAEHSVY